MKQQSQQSKNDNQNKSTMINQLKQMGFQSFKIQQAIKILKCEQKDKIVQYLINDNQQFNDKKNKNMQQQSNDFEDFQQDYKMLFLARMDLKLPLSIMATHVATGALSAFKQLQSKIDYDSEAQIAYFQWQQSGQKKIVVKVNSQKQLLELVQKLRKQKVNVFIVKADKNDQLQLQSLKLNVKQGTITVAAIGPASQEVLDKFTKHLKLY